MDLSNIYWISMITNPKPNSTADRTKKKNVRDSKFRLSNIRPESSTIIYSVTHNNSAVNNKCNAVFTLTSIVRKKKKNIISVKLMSPKIKIYKSLVKACLF